MAIDTGTVGQWSTIGSNRVARRRRECQGRVSHLAGIEHGSHGELVDGLLNLTDADRGSLEAGEPLVLRLSVPNDAKQAGGLCLLERPPGKCRSTRL